MKLCGSTSTLTRTPPRGGAAAERGARRKSWRSTPRGAFRRAGSDGARAEHRDRRLRRTEQRDFAWLDCAADRSQSAFLPAARTCTGQVSPSDVRSSVAMSGSASFATSGSIQSAARARGRSSANTPWDVCPKCPFGANRTKSSKSGAKQPMTRAEGKKPRLAKRQSGCGVSESEWHCSNYDAYPAQAQRTEESRQGPPEVSG